MVGFAMYEPRGNGVFSVHRLMIDAAHQNQGIGSWSMRLVMDTIVGLGGETIYLSFQPKNIEAKRLFEKFGFVFHEREPDGEVVYRFGPARDIET